MIVGGWQAPWAAAHVISSQEAERGVNADTQLPYSFLFILEPQTLGRIPPQLNLPKKALTDMSRWNPGDFRTVDS